MLTHSSPNPSCLIIPLCTERSTIVLLTHHKTRFIESQLFSVFSPILVSSRVHWVLLSPVELNQLSKVVFQVDSCQIMGRSSMAN